MRLTLLLRVPPLRQSRPKLRQISLRTLRGWVQEWVANMLPKWLPGRPLAVSAADATSRFAECCRRRIPFAEETENVHLPSGAQQQARLQPMREKVQWLRQTQRVKRQTQRVKRRKPLNDSVKAADATQQAAAKAANATQQAAARGCRCHSTSCCEGC